jgi:DNA-binding LacI/PurR family transcriptional regulator
MALPLFPESPGGIKIFTMADSRRVGIEVGRFLVAQGHKRVAYISPVHEQTWSVGRLEGIRAAYQSAGMPEAVEAFTGESAPLVRGGPMLVRTRAVSDAVSSVFAADLEGVPGSDRILERAASALQAEASAVLEREATRHNTTPLARLAAAKPHITAWVGANDTVALECLEFVKRQSGNDGNGTAVVGFDDTLEAFLARMTSYNFGYSAAVRAMLGHVLHPPVRPPRSQRIGPAVEISGYITGRASTHKSPG